MMDGGNFLLIVIKKPFNTFDVDHQKVYVSGERLV